MKDDHIYNEMQAINADGIDFMPVWFDRTSPAPIISSYTKEQWIEQKAYPKSNYRLWRIDEYGCKQYVDHVHHQSEKKALLEYLDAPVLTNARNSMGCSENWYNSYYAIKQTFTRAEIESFSEDEIQRLVKLGDNIAEGLY